MANYTPVELPYFAPEDQLPAPLPTFEEIMDFIEAERDHKSRQMSQRIASRTAVTPVTLVDFRAEVLVAELSDEASKYERQRPQMKDRCVEYWSSYSGPFNEHYFIKFGEDDPTHMMDGLEVDGALNMVFVKEHTNIAVPKVYAIYEHEHEGRPCAVVISERIHGNRLSDMIREPLDQNQVNSIGLQLRSYLEQMARIPATNYFGSIGRRPYFNLYIPDGYGPDKPSPSDPHYVNPGPFSNPEDVNMSIWKNLVGLESKHFQGREDLWKPYTELFDKAFPRFRAEEDGDRAPVFSHGRIEPKSIIVKEDGTVVLIRWEHAGFFPRSYEYFSSDSRAVTYATDLTYLENSIHYYNWSKIRSRFPVPFFKYCNKVTGLWLIVFETRRRVDEALYREQQQKSGNKGRSSSVVIS
ncbi:hypothetical protein F4821DRAFT_260240 [Hypoxylon rubiginosum]|uniref:Uncharacterized protein n=1 Tax=Hypoxylon rubiginosum TaxID=110542 RepID=A0ACC0D085_9PEZI|nr:hypothetical protein F4821DRAFT_260240 [Hypoxylon rubiginosum]